MRHARGREDPTCEAIARHASQTVGEGHGVLLVDGDVVVVEHGRPDDGHGYEWTFSRQWPHQASSEAWYLVRQRHDGTVQPCSVRMVARKTVERLDAAVRRWVEKGRPSLDAQRRPWAGRARTRTATERFPAGGGAVYLGGDRSGPALVWLGPGTRVRFGFNRPGASLTTVDAPERFGGTPQSWREFLRFAERFAAAGQERHRRGRATSRRVRRVWRTA